MKSSQTEVTSTTSVGIDSLTVIALAPIHQDVTIKTQISESDRSSNIHQLTLESRVESLKNQMNSSKQIFGYGAKSMQNASLSENIKFTNHLKSDEFVLSKPFNVNNDSKPTRNNLQANIVSGDNSFEGDLSPSAAL